MGIFLTIQAIQNLCEEFAKLTATPVVPRGFAGISEISKQRNSRSVLTGASANIITRHFFEIHVVYTFGMFQ